MWKKSQKEARLGSIILKGKKTKKEIQKTAADIGKIYKGMNYNEAVANAFAYYDALSEIDPTLVMNRDKYKVTEKIAEMTGADLYKIEPVVPYPKKYDDIVNVVRKENEERQDN